jgi:hypothetical protein
MLDVFTCTLGTMLLHAKATQANVNASFSRCWESIAHERDFQRELAALRAVNDFQSRLIVAR